MSQATLNWAADTDDYAERKGTGSLLHHALRLSGGHKQAVIRDSGGVCAYETTATVLVAKKETYGDIISISNHILRHAVERQKPVIMYLGRTRAFYRFDPQQVINETKFLNYKDGILMNNASIKLGERIA